MIDLFPNATIFIQWGLFAVALITLHFGIFRPTLRILRERRLRTEGERETAKSLEIRALELTALCEKKVEEARATGGRKKEEIRAAGEKVVAGLLQKTRGDMEAQMEAMRQTIERESREASMQLKQHAQEIAREIAGKVLGREI